MLRKNRSLSFENLSLTGCQFIPKSLSEFLQNVIDHAYDMELIDHNANVWKHHLDGVPVGLSHTHHYNLSLVVILLFHEPSNHNRSM
jgi:hypothetical protein